MIPIVIQSQLIFKVAYTQDTCKNINKCKSQAIYEHKSLSTKPKDTIVSEEMEKEFISMLITIIYDIKMETMRNTLGKIFENQPCKRNTAMKQKCQKLNRSISNIKKKASKS